MTTLLISEVFPPKKGGSSRWFWEIYRRLARRDYVIAAGHDPYQAEFDRSNDLRLSRVPLALPDLGMLSAGGLRGYWQALQAIRKIVQTERITRVHCGRCIPEGWIGLLLKNWCGIPYVCYAHGEEIKLPSHQGANGVMSSRQLRWMAHRVFRAADLIIANSQNTRRLLIEEWRVPPRRVQLLHPGVDTGHFAPAPMQPAVRARLGWGNRPVVLTVGRLQKRKGHDQMILALHAVRRVLPNVLYAILGAGEERQNLEDLVAREGLRDNIQFLGELDDSGMVQCYQQCDLFVFPNRQVGSDIEGFGMVLLEAQACGKPVVAGDSGGTAETMRIPETGRIISCEAPEELGAVVTGLLTDHALRARMGAAARRWVLERFDWSTLSRQAELLFRPAPNGKSPCSAYAKPVCS